MSPLLIIGHLHKVVLWSMNVGDDGKYFLRHALWGCGGFLGTVGGDNTRSLRPVDWDICIHISTRHNPI